MKMSAVELHQRKLRAREEFDLCGRELVQYQQNLSELKQVLLCRQDAAETPGEKALLTTASDLVDYLKNKAEKDLDVEGEQFDNDVPQVNAFEYELVADDASDDDASDDDASDDAASIASDDDASEDDALEPE